MPSYDNSFGSRFDWRFRPGRRIVKDSSQPEQTPSGDSGTSEQDKRETPDQDKPEHKSITKRFKCPTEPFFETLRILDELL